MKYKFGLVRLFGLYNGEKLNNLTNIQYVLRYRMSDGKIYHLVSQTKLHDMEFRSACIWKTVEIICEIPSNITDKVILSDLILKSQIPLIEVVR